MARVLIALALLAAPAQAQLAEKRRELSKVQGELKKTLAELEALRSEARELDQDVSRLEGLDAKSRQRLETLQANIRQAESRRSELKGRLDAASQVGGFWAASLAAEAGNHMGRRTARSDFHGRTEIWGEEFRRAAILEKGAHLRGLMGFQKQTEEQEAAARKKAAELAENRRKAQAEREGRRKEYESKKSQLEQTQGKVAEAARRARELEESARALTGLLDKLGKAGTWRKTGPVATLDRPKNSLPWPAHGRILSGYGREKDPQLGTWTVRQGLTIGTTPASPVTAVADGKVIFSGPFRSYGQVVIVDHGEGFFSVYGQLGEIKSGKGVEVKAGQAIAGAGGSGTDGRVYLELRRGTEALDPMAWLEKRQ